MRLTVRRGHIVLLTLILVLAIAMTDNDAPIIVVWTVYALLVGMQIGRESA